MAPTAAEQALIDRAANSPTLAIQSNPAFAISSNSGLIFFADFSDARLDVNNNGIADCDESFIGTTGFGGGGCYVSTPGGGVRPFQDGIISTGQNQFGGDGADESFSAQTLIPRSRRYNANVNGRFEFSPAFEMYAEAKYVRTETRSQNPYNTFYDSLLIFPDNPFIPAPLVAAAQERGGVRVSRDFIDLGPAFNDSDRDTYRLVTGLRGDLTPHLRYDVYGNFGRTDDSTTASNTVLYDRLFAAIDVVQGPNGPRCRSDTDPTPHPGSEFFPVIEGGFFTFRPGDGQCVPVNILAGENSVSQAGVDFITTPTTTRSRLQQFVVSAQLAGDTGGFFRMPGGAIQFALGAEYRKEKSRTRFDALELGIFPATAPGGLAGSFIGDISGNQSLTFDAATRTFDTSGRFDVYDVFGEVSIPVLADITLIKEFTVGGAARYSKYSTVGGAFTWNVNGIYAPIPDIRFRATYAKAIRAPNISELFSPQQGATFRPSDPCEQATIDALVAAGDLNATNRLANCRADGLPVGFSDPLTARFSGTSGGNPDLEEETAKTLTAGVVVQPRFVPGLSISADFYKIKIESAIAAVSAQDIVNNCYDQSSFPNRFCDLFTRNRTVGSPTFLGFNFLRQTQLNFGRIETSGIDGTVAYNFRLGLNRFLLRATGNWTKKVNRFFDPADPTLVNPGLKELGAPKFSGVGSATFNRGPVSLSYRLQYIGKQGLGPVQIERLALEFGPAGIAKEKFVHDASFTIEAGKEFEFYGGVNNFTGVKPYITNSAYPVSPLGPFFFIGTRVRL